VSVLRFIFLARELAGDAADSPLKDGVGLELAFI
jgi:hypothetical protein